VANPLDRFVEHNPIHDFDFQKHWLMDQALRTESSSIKTERLICNLLVLEKPPGKVHAFRFSSPRLGAMRDLRDEKRNLLLLYGWLHQEKPFRVNPGAIEMHWADLFPRQRSSSQIFFFDEKETMDDQALWKYLHVPFEVVVESLRQAGQVLRTQISQVIRKAAPGSIRERLLKANQPTLF
jgi:hypothetical protein